MVEYKVYLKLKLPRQQDNIMGLSWERYEVVNCEYEFTQGVNREGEVNGSGITCAGRFHATSLAAKFPKAAKVHGIARMKYFDLMEQQKKHKY